MEEKPDHDSPLQSGDQTTLDNTEYHRRLFRALIAPSSPQLPMKIRQLPPLSYQELRGSLEEAEHAFLEAEQAFLENQQAYIEAESIYRGIFHDYLEAKSVYEQASDTYVESLTGYTQISSPDSFSDMSGEEAQIAYQQAKELYTEIEKIHHQAWNSYREMREGYEQSLQEYSEQEALYLATNQDKHLSMKNHIEILEDGLPPDVNIAGL